MQMTYRVTSFGCVPADESTKATLSKAGVGALFTHEWKQVRNPAHHRLRFAWMTDLFAAIEHLGLFGNKELLRQHLTLKTEFVNTIVDPRTGEVFRTPRSWSYASMDEEEFSRMVPQIRDYLLNDFLELCIERGKWDEGTILHFQMVADQ